MSETDNVAFAIWLRSTLDDESVRIEGVTRLGGGAVQKNWRVDLATSAGRRSLVVRQDTPASIHESHNRHSEYLVLCAVHEAGLLVPRPVAFCSDPDVLGRPFALLEAVPGVGFGPRIVREGTLGGARDRLVRRLGRELARIHAFSADEPTLASLARARPRPPLQRWGACARALTPCELSVPR
jgi:aminoglycoside phosphotransferase (APT) family kinase protein